MPVCISFDLSLHLSICCDGDSLANPQATFDAGRLHVDIAFGDLGLGDAMSWMPKRFENVVVLCAPAYSVGGNLIPVELLDGR